MKEKDTEEKIQELMLKICELVDKEDFDHFIVVKDFIWFLDGNRIGQD